MRGGLLPSVAIAFALLLSCCGEVSESSEVDEFPFSERTPCPASVTVSEAGDGFLRFCGAFTTRTVGDLLEQLEDSGSRKLVIDSVGGDTEVSMLLGQYLQRNNVKLFVNDICLSACAQIVAIAAPELHLRPHSIFGMHDTQYSTNILVGENAVREGMSQLASKEQDYYEALGVPTTLLTVPTSELELGCIVSKESYRDSGVLSIKGGYHYYMPDAEYFMAIFPGKLMTGWPEKDTVYSWNSSMARPLKLLYGHPRFQTLSMLHECD